MSAVGGDDDDEYAAQQFSDYNDDDNNQNGAADEQDQEENHGDHKTNDRPDQDDENYDNEGDNVNNNNAAGGSGGGGDAEDEDQDYQESNNYADQFDYQRTAVEDEEDRDTLHFSNVSYDEFSKIRQLIISQQFQRALNEVEAYLDKQPTHVEAINLKVHCLRQIAGQKDINTNRKCIEMLKKSLQEEPGQVLSLFNIASCLYELGEYHSAIEYYSQVGGTDARVLFNLALCYERLGDVYNAQVHYDKTLKLNNKLSCAVVNYSNLLMRMGETDASRALLESHLKNAPRDDKALNNLNIALAEKRQDKKADFLFKRVINSQTDFAPSLLYNHGVLYFKQNKLIPALEAFQKFTQLANVQETDPLNLLAYVNQGLIFEKLAQYESALTVYQTILERFGDIVNNSEFEGKIVEMKEKILRRLASKNYNNTNGFLPMKSATDSFMPPVNGAASTSKSRQNPFMQIKQKYHLSQPQILRTTMYQPNNHINGGGPSNRDQLNHSDGAFNKVPRSLQQTAQQQQQTQDNLVKIDNYLTNGAAPKQQGMSRPTAIPALQRKGSQEHSKQRFNSNSQTLPSAIPHSNPSANGNGSNNNNRNVNFQHLDRLSQPRKQPKEDQNTKQQTTVEASPNRTIVKQPQANNHNGNNSSSSNAASVTNSAVFERLARQSKMPEASTRQSQQSNNDMKPIEKTQSQAKMVKPTKLASLHHMKITEPVRANQPPPPVNQFAITQKVSPKNLPSVARQVSPTKTSQTTQPKQQNSSAVVPSHSPSKNTTGESASKQPKVQQTKQANNNEPKKETPASAVVATSDKQQVPKESPQQKVILTPKEPQKLEVQPAAPQVKEEPKQTVEKSINHEEKVEQQPIEPVVQSSVVDKSPSINSSKKGPEQPQNTVEEPVVKDKKAENPVNQSSMPKEPQLQPQEQQQQQQQQSVEQKQPVVAPSEKQQDKIPPVAAVVETPKKQQPQEQTQNQPVPLKTEQPAAPTIVVTPQTPQKQVQEQIPTPVKQEPQSKEQSNPQQQSEPVQVKPIVPTKGASTGNAIQQQQTPTTPAKEKIAEPQVSVDEKKPKENPAPPQIVVVDVPSAQADKINTTLNSDKQAAAVPAPISSVKETSKTEVKSSDTLPEKPKVETQQQVHSTEQSSDSKNPAPVQVQEQKSSSQIDASVPIAPITAADKKDQVITVNSSSGTTVPQKSEKPTDTIQIAPAPTSPAQQKAESTSTNVVVPQPSETIQPVKATTAEQSDKPVEAVVPANKEVAVPQAEVSDQGTQKQVSPPQITVSQADQSPIKEQQVVQESSKVESEKQVQKEKEVVKQIEPEKKPVDQPTPPIVVILPEKDTQSVEKVEEQQHKEATAAVPTINILQEQAVPSDKPAEAKPAAIESAATITTKQPPKDEEDQQQPSQPEDNNNEQSDVETHQISQLPEQQEEGDSKQSGIQSPTEKENQLMKKTSGYQITITQYRSSEKLSELANQNNNGAAEEQEEEQKENSHNTSLDDSAIQQEQQAAHQAHLELSNKQQTASNQEHLEQQQQESVNEQQQQDKNQQVNSEEQSESNVQKQQDGQQQEDTTVPAAPVIEGSRDTQNESQVSIEKKENDVEAEGKQAEDQTKVEGSDAQKEQGEKNVIKEEDQVQIQESKSQTNEDEQKQVQDEGEQKQDEQEPQQQESASQEDGSKQQIEVAADDQTDQVVDPASENQDQEGQDMNSNEKQAGVDEQEKKDHNDDQEVETQAKPEGTDEESVEAKREGTNEQLVETNNEQLPEGQENTIAAESAQETQNQQDSGQDQALPEVAGNVEEGSDNNQGEGDVEKEQGDQVDAVAVDQQEAVDKEQQDEQQVQVDENAEGQQQENTNPDGAAVDAEVEKAEAGDNQKQESEELQPVVPAAAEALVEGQTGEAAAAANNEDNNGEQQQDLMIAQMLAGNIPLGENHESQSAGGAVDTPTNTNNDSTARGVRRDSIMSSRARQLLESNQSSPSGKNRRSKRGKNASSMASTLPADFDEWTKSKCQAMIAANEEKSYLAHYKLGVLGIESNDIQGAKDHFLAVAEMQPDFIPERIQFAIAEILMQQKEYESALNHYKLYYKHAAEKFDARMKIGRCFKKMGNLDAAIKGYENAAANNPSKNFKPFYKLARLKLMVDDVKGAIDNFLKALSLSSENIKILLRLGQIYLEMDSNGKSKKTDTLLDDEAPKNKASAAAAIHELSQDIDGYLNEALYYLSQAIQLDPNSYEALISLGKLYDKKFELSNAIKFTELAVAHADHNINAVYYLGTLYLKNQDITQSGNCFKKVLQEDPEHVPSLIEYATILSLKGEYEKSKKYFKIALKKNPNNLICNLRLGKIYQQKLNNLDGAMECYKKIISLEPQYSKAHFQLGLVYASKQDFKRSVESFKYCLTINPKNAAAWREIGSVFQETGNPTKALKYYEKGQSLDANDPKIESGIANCYYFMENYDTAIEKFEEILKKRIPSASSSSQASRTSISSTSRLPSAQKLKQRKNQTPTDYDEVLHNLGDCYFMKDDMDNAIINYEKALRMKPNKPDCLYNLGNAYCMKGRYDEALRTFDRCVEFDSSNASAFYNLANVYYILNDQQSAWMYFEKAITLEPDNVDWRNYVAQTYYDSGAYDSALTHLQASFGVQNKNFETCYRITLTFLALNSVDDAKQYLNICLELEPENEDALKLQQEIESGKSFLKSRSGSRHSHSMLRESSISHVEENSFGTIRKNSSSMSIKSNKELSSGEQPMLSSLRNRTQRSPITTSIRIPEEKNE